MPHDRLVAILVIACAVLLFAGAPALIAFARRHPERLLIAKLSPGGLFSFVLWGALMVWAVSDTRDESVISKYVARIRTRNQLPMIVAGLIVLGIATGAIALML